MADVDLTPTAEMARNAARGLELRREHGRGGTEVGVARARDISNGKTLSPETVRRMHAFFSRHAKNKAGGEDDAGYIAWMLWGGDEGRDWASRKVDALDRKERNAMSDTRKAIMERLGMAATNDRPGAKAKFAQSLQDYQRLIGEFNALDKEIGRLIDRAKEMSAKSDRILSLFPKNERDPDAAAIASSRQAMAELRKELNVMLSRFQFSRPGSKARMSKDWQTIERYLEVLDTEFGEPRGKAAAQEMMRAAAAIGGDEGARLKSAINTMATSRDYNARQRAYNVIASMMPFSRPGAKAEMANYIRTVAEDKEASRRGLRRMIDQLESEWQSLNNQPSKAGRIPRMETIKKQIAGLEERLKSLSSRPGAKVRAALADACWEGYEAVGTKPQDGKTVPNCVPKATAAKPAEGDLEREDVKAGLKLMSASDPAVSDKIRKLIKEGKPQDQAVAIALDMKRRGEL